MAGLVPAIHGFAGRVKGVDTRDKPGQDGSVFPQLGISPDADRLAGMGKPTVTHRLGICLRPRSNSD